MRLRRTVGLVLGSVVLAQGCGDDADGGKGGGDNPGLRGDFLPCAEEPRSTALGWDEVSPLDISAREAFSAIAGSCQAPFSWDASSAGVMLAPPAAETQIEVTLTLDQESARLSEPQPAHDSEGCEPSLQIDAEVQIETADGVFAEREQVTLSYTKRDGVSEINFMRASNKLAGSLRVDTKPNQQAFIQFRSAGAGNACAGELRLDTNQTLSTSMSSGSSGPLGAWSNSGCPLGKEAVALDGSSALGTAIRTKIAETWGMVRYAGVWDDGEASSLDLRVTTAAKQACAQHTGLRLIEVPVLLTYATSRLDLHDTEAQVNVSRDDDDRITQLQLSLSESMRCGRPADPFPYTGEACGNLASVTVQLSLNEYTPAMNVSGTALQIYKYRRSSSDGAADEVERLTLEGPPLPGQSRDPQR